MFLWSLVLALAVIASACSPRRPSAANTPPGPITESSFTTHYGQDASDIARHIPGCAAVTALPVPAPQTSNATRISTCTLRGHRIVIYSWPDRVSEDLATSLLDSSPPAYAARGPGWTEILGDSAPLDIQKTIAGAVAQVLGGSIAEYR
jgi:hypothetical protein